MLRDTLEEWVLLCPTKRATPGVEDAGKTAAPSSSLLPSSAGSHSIDVAAPHWGSYDSPPTNILPDQCRLLRPNILPKLSPGCSYAFVRKSHSQLLLLGNNVVIIHRADTPARVPIAAATKEEGPRDVRSSSASGMFDALDDKERSGKRVKF